MIRLKDELQKSAQRREKMLTEAVLAEREAWEHKVAEMKGEHVKQVTVMEKMISKATSVVPSPIPDENEDVTSKLMEAEQLINTQQTNLLQKEKEIAAMKTEASGSALHELRERLEKSERLVETQREIIRTKEEQLRTAIDSAMGEDTMLAEGNHSLDVDSRQLVEKLKVEKEVVLEKAKQAVDELTSQLAKTRSAREKELERYRSFMVWAVRHLTPPVIHTRKLRTTEEAINNLRQQAAIDLQVSTDDHTCTICVHLGY